MSLPKPYGYAIFTKDGQPDADHFSKRELLPADKEAGYSEIKLFTEDQVQILLDKPSALGLTQTGAYINALPDVVIGITNHNKIVVRFHKGSVPHSQIELGDATINNIDSAIYALNQLKLYCS